MGTVERFGRGIGATMAAAVGACIGGSAWGQMVFGPTETYVVGDLPTDAVAADFNGDSVLDLLMANNHGGSFSMLLGAGDGTFAAPVTIPLASDPIRVAAGDVNNDSFVDVVYTDFNGKKVVVMLNDGNGILGPEVEFALPLVANSVVAADLNADGWLDLLVGMGLYTGGMPDRNTLAVLMNLGGGVFDSPVIFLSGTLSLLDVHAADMDNDGDLDALAPDWPSGGINWLRSNGDGTFASLIERVRTAGGQSAAIDLNGDTLTDVAGFIRDGTLGWAIGLGGGAFVDGNSRYEITTQPRTTDLLAADFDGDGDDDVVQFNQNETPNNSRPVSRFFRNELPGYRVFRNNGDATLTGQASVLFGVLPQGGAVGDFDRDSAIDIALVDAISDRVYILRNVTPPALFGQPTHVALTDIPREYLRSADFDDDGHVDLATAVVESDGQVVPGSAAVFYNDRFGGFAEPPVEYPVGDTPIALDAGDWNRDGLPDIVVANSWSTDLSLLINEGNRSFAPDTRISMSGTLPSAVVMKDLNNDGLPDLAVADRGNLRGIVLAYQGSGGGVTIFDHPLDAHRFSNLAVADFNEDQRQDVIATLAASNQVEVFLNTATGRLARGVIHTLISEVASVTTADFDHDGHVDAAVATNSGVVVLWGAGTGAFPRRSTVPVGNVRGPGEIVADDLNDDGWADLAVAGRLSTGVGYVLNDGDGGFVPGGEVYIGAHCTGLAAGDLDSDQDIDLATVSHPDDPLQIRRLSTMMNTSMYRGGGGSAGMHLALTALVRGRQSRMEVSGALSGDHVHFFASFRGPGEVGPVIGNGNFTLNLESPVYFLGAAMADSLGKATIQTRVLDHAPAVPVWTQAAVDRGRGTPKSGRSNVVESVIQKR